MKNFNEVDIPQSLLHRLQELNFTTPTPVQAESIPYALQGHDILGSAQTGTGKTGAFGIPLITHMIRDEDAKALILVPTRELALQVMDALKQFIGRDNIKTALLIGGEPIGKQFKQLRNRPRLIIGTPGRVNDHLKRRTVEFDETNFLVLDEVDRMLDMGFSVQLDEIAKYLPAKRQTLMFSATMPKNMGNIAAKYLKDPVRVTIGSTTAAAPKVKQEFIKVRDEEKYTQLITELEARTGSIIIFIKTKYNAENMAKKLRGKGYEAEAIHGDLKQSRRARVIKLFREKQYRILVATDVASRGLDIPHIEHVINYDAPHNPEDYIHRIGRTARAGADGEAVNFMGNRDARQWIAVQRLLNPDDKQSSYSPRGGRKKESFYERKRQNGRKSAFGGKKSNENKPWKNDNSSEGKHTNSRDKNERYKSKKRDDRPDSRSDRDGRSDTRSANNNDARRNSRSDERSDFKKDFKKKDFKGKSRSNFGKDFRKDSDRDDRSEGRRGSNDGSKRDYPKKDYSNRDSGNRDSNRGPRRDSRDDSSRDSSRSSNGGSGKWERKSSGGSSEGGKKPYRSSNGGGKSYSSNNGGGSSYAGKNKASRRRFNNSNG